MLHIVLLILKIIGIVLGALLGILLLGLCLALFVPLHYQFQAKRTEKEGDPPIEVSAKFTWLLHLLNVKVCYPSDVYVRVRLFILTVFRLPGKEKKKKTKKQKKQRPEEQKPEGQAQESRKNGKVSDSAADKTADTGKATDSAGEETSVDAKAQGEGVQEEKQEETQEKKSRKGRMKAFFHGIKEKILKIGRFFQNIWYTIKGICDKIKVIWENIDYYLNIVKGDAFKQAYALCKDEIGAVFSYIKPRKMTADLVIGTGDPASTAKILSYYGMLYPVVGNFVTVTPDFDEKRIEGTVFIKGKVRLFTILKAAVRIYFNKDIRRLYKLFKKEDI